MFLVSISPTEWGGRQKQKQTLTILLSKKGRMEYPVSIVVKTCFNPEEMDIALAVMNHQLSSQFQNYKQKFQILFGKRYLRPLGNSNDKQCIEIHIIQNTLGDDSVYFDDNADLTGYICNAAVFAIESTMPLEKHVIISAVTWYKVGDYIDPSLVFDGYVFDYPKKDQKWQKKASRFDPPRVASDL